MVPSHPYHLAAALLRTLNTGDAHRNCSEWRLPLAEPLRCRFPTFGVCQDGHHPCYRPYPVEVPRRRRSQSQCLQVHHDHHPDRMCLDCPRKLVNCRFTFRNGLSDDVHRQGREDEAHTHCCHSGVAAFCLCGLPGADTQQYTQQDSDGTPLQYLERTNHRLQQREGTCSEIRY